MHAEAERYADTLTETLSVIEALITKDLTDLEEVLSLSPAEREYVTEYVTDTDDLASFSVGEAWADSVLDVTTITRRSASSSVEDTSVEVLLTAGGPHATLLFDGDNIILTVAWDDTVRRDVSNLFPALRDYVTIWFE